MAPKRRQTADKITSSLLAIHASGRPAALTIVSADPVHPPKTVPTMPVALVREQQHPPNIDLPTAPAFAVAPIVSDTPAYPAAPTTAASTRSVAAVQHPRPVHATSASEAPAGQEDAQERHGAHGERLNRLESKNPFHQLPLDTHDPASHLPKRSYAAAAARPPSHSLPSPRTTTHLLSAPPPRLLPPREAVLLRSSALPTPHRLFEKLHALPPVPSPLPPLLPSRNRATSASSAPEPSTQRTMSLIVLASRSCSKCKDEGPGPVPDFSLPVPTRLLPAWRTHDSE
ncbi:hypothetical protein JCM8097_006109 [Rhodosporidiobolus ruineniae]